MELPSPALSSGSPTKAPLPNIQTVQQSPPARNRQLSDNSPMIRVTNSGQPIQQNSKDTPSACSSAQQVPQQQPVFIKQSSGASGQSQQVTKARELQIKQISNSAITRGTQQQFQNSQSKNQNQQQNGTTSNSQQTTNPTQNSVATNLGSVQAQQLNGEHSPDKTQQGRFLNNRDNNQNFSASNQKPAQAGTQQNNLITLPQVRLTLCLRDCKYSIFHKIALHHYHWRVLAYEQIMTDNGWIDGPLQVTQLNRETGEVMRLPASNVVNQQVQWDINWQDHGISPDLLTSLAPHQRVNHFLGMYNIARKNTLGIHLKRFRKEFPDAYTFFPETWIYPSDFHEILAYNEKKQKKRQEQIADGVFTKEQSEQEPPVLYIVKPEAGCQGRGIFIVRKLEELQEKLDTKFKARADDRGARIREEEQRENREKHGLNAVDRQQVEVNEEREKIDNSFVIQKYLAKPALWQGHKYDFRIYVLVTSMCDPMSIFIYKEGLVRLASEKYEGVKNTQDSFMHLTNYSLNKKNEHYDDDQHKLKLSECLTGTLSQPPTRKGKQGVSRTAEAIWEDIDGIVVKTIATVQPQMSHIFKSCQAKEPDCCFELLGFDIMLDQKLKPWMLEVNHTPSFNADTQVDSDVKTNLIRDCLEIMAYSVDNRKRVQQELRREQQQANLQALAVGQTKRLTVMEHAARVRLDPQSIVSKFPDNGFRLIYPKEAPGEDPQLFDKIVNRADAMWKKATGTVTQLNRFQKMMLTEEKERKKQAKKKKLEQEKKKLERKKARELQNQQDDDEESDQVDDGDVSSDNNEKKEDEQDSPKKVNGANHPPDKLSLEKPPNGAAGNNLTDIIESPSAQKEDSKKIAGTEKQNNFGAVNTQQKVGSSNFSHSTPTRGQSNLVRMTDFCTCRDQITNSSAQQQRRTGLPGFQGNGNNSVLSQPQGDQYGASATENSLSNNTTQNTTQATIQPSSNNLHSKTFSTQPNASNRLHPNNSSNTNDANICPNCHKRRTLTHRYVVQAKQQALQQQIAQQQQLAWAQMYQAFSGGNNQFNQPNYNMFSSLPGANGAVGMNGAGPNSSAKQGAVNNPVLNNKWLQNEPVVDMQKVDDAYQKFVAATQGCNQRELRMRYRDYCKALMERQVGQAIYQQNLEYLKSQQGISHQSMKNPLPGAMQQPNQSFNSQTMPNLQKSALHQNNVTNNNQPQGVNGNGQQNPNQTQINQQYQMSLENAQKLAREMLMFNSAANANNPNMATDINQAASDPRFFEYIHLKQHQQQQQAQFENIQRQIRGGQIIGNQRPYPAGQNAIVPPDNFGARNQALFFQRLGQFLETQPMDPDQRNKIWRTMQANIDQVNKIQNFQSLSGNPLPMPNLPPASNMPGGQNNNNQQQLSNQFESLFGGQGNKINSNQPQGRSTHPVGGSNKMNSRRQQNGNAFNTGSTAQSGPPGVGQHSTSNVAAGSNNFVDIEGMPRNLAQLNAQHHNTQSMAGHGQKEQTFSVITMGSSVASNHMGTNNIYTGQKQNQFGQNSNVNKNNSASNSNNLLTQQQARIAQANNQNTLAHLLRDAHSNEHQKNRQSPGAHMYATNNTMLHPKQHPNSLANDDWQNFSQIRATQGASNSIQNNSFPSQQNRTIHPNQNAATGNGGAYNSFAQPQQLQRLRQEGQNGGPGASGADKGSNLQYQGGPNLSSADNQTAADYGNSLPPNPVKSGGSTGSAVSHSNKHPPKDMLFAAHHNYQPPGVANMSTLAARREQSNGMTIFGSTGRQPVSNSQQAQLSTTSQQQKVQLGKGLNGGQGFSGGARQSANEVKVAAAAASLNMAGSTYSLRDLKEFETRLLEQNNNGQTLQHLQRRSERSLNHLGDHTHQPQLSTKAAAQALGVGVGKTDGKPPQQAHQRGKAAANTTTGGGELPLIPNQSI